MNSHLKKTARTFVSGVLLLTLLVTASLPPGVGRAHAAPHEASGGATGAPGWDVPAAQPGGAAARAAAAFAPTPEQTSAFLAGDVAVRVLFVESTAGPENWTASEVDQVKREISQALDWWTTVAAVPAIPGGQPRPTANLTWNVSYVSPFDGPSGDRAKIQVGLEPIQSSVASASRVDAANPANSGWIHQVASAFTGLPADGSSVRQLAHDARVTSGADWGLVLYVVDSSSDTDGLFDGDGQPGGAALNGPWALVTSRGGALRTDRLEILIAKMIGHVFGAGDESYDPNTGGCRQEEVYGYLRVAHFNCENNNAVPQPSLMRSGQAMISAYAAHALSEAARQQVGWRDADESGLYDVFETLKDTFGGFPDAQVCPVLHLAGVPIDTVPALPLTFGAGDSETNWSAYVWDRSQQTFVSEPRFTPVAINYPQYVWGRVNRGDWVAADPADGGWDSLAEAYNVRLSGFANTSNLVEIAILDRWHQQVYMSPEPIQVRVIPPAQATGDPNADIYQSDDASRVALYTASGAPGGWTASVNDDGYSPGGPGALTMIADGVGSAACFSFTGTEVTLLYSKESGGAANVYVNGNLHSTIPYSDEGRKRAEHRIANLPFAAHTVSLVATAGVVDIDAFALSTISPEGIIDAGPGGDISPDKLGFWEQGEPKITYVGTWSAVALPAPGRPGTPDGSGYRAARTYDRVYAHFINADTVAIYRGVFPGGGTADVYVDGVRRGTMSNEARTAHVAPFYVSGLAPSVMHTVEVRLNPDAPYLDFDAFRFLNLLQDPTLHRVDTPGAALNVPFTGAQEAYGWETRTSFLRSNQTGALLTLFFKGSGVAVNVKTSSANGPLEIYVDGRLERTVDLKDTSAKNVPIAVVGLDPELPHVLQVRHLNANPARPRFNEVYGYTVYYTAPVGPGTYEEYEYGPDGKPTYSSFVYEQGWTLKSTTARPGPSGGRFIESKHPEARAYLSFLGADTVTVYGISRSTYGAADIYVDGVLHGTLYLKGTANRSIPYTVTGLDSGEFHTLEVRVHEGRGFAKTIALDKIELYNKPVLAPGHYESNALVSSSPAMPAIQFSGQWTATADTRASGGGYHSSAGMTWQTYQPAPVVEAVFEVEDATSVVVYYRQFRKYGLVDVYVNGQYHSSFNSYAASPLDGSFQQPYIIAGLDPAINNTIALKPQPAGRSKNRYDPFDLDAILVRAGDMAGINYLEAGYYENNHPIALGGGAISHVGASWTVGTTSRASGKGDTARVLFYGNAFTVYFNRTTDGGRADILVDGKLYGTYNTRSTVPDRVPFSVVGLDDGLHTAEIVVSSRFVNIDAYEVHNRLPVAGPAVFDLAPTDGRVILSGAWKVEGDTLRTSEKDARAYVYIADSDSLLVVSDVFSRTGAIEVSARGAPHSLIEASWIRVQTPPEAAYLVSGLGNVPGGTWLEIRNPDRKTIALRRLEIFDLTPTLGGGQRVEAEGVEIVRAAGTWAVKPGTPNPIYSGGRHLESVGTAGRFYIPVQGVDYVTVYRSIGSFGNANIYIDGVLWGTMPNSSSRTAHQVPFSIGPIPDPQGRHIIELRAASTRRFSLDWVEAHGLTVIGPGYYENDHPVFVGGTDPLTGETYAQAYTGSWSQIASANSSGGSLHQAIRRGDRLTAVFEGNAVTIYRQLWSDGRYMTAYIDGIPYPLNNKAATHAHQVAHTILLPNAGPHSLELVVDSGRARFDAIEFRHIVPAVYGAYQHDSLHVAVNDNRTWAETVTGLHSADSYIWADDKFASVFLLFNGTRATFYMHTGRDWGIASVYVDGRLHGEVSQYAPDPGELFVAYDVRGLEPANHVVEVRFEGKKEAKARRRQINLDAFTVNGHPVPRPGDIPLPVEPSDADNGDPDRPDVGCFEEGSEKWTYVAPSETNWLTMFSSSASGGMVLHGRGEPGDPIHAEFTFNGEGFAFLYHKGQFGGMADIYLDGVFLERLDMYNASDAWLDQAKYEVTGLTPGVHKLRVVFTGEMNPASSDRYIYIDRVDVPVYNPACNP
jgi:hypothetical protein